MRNDKCVSMIQTSQCNWHIKSPKGHILMDNITVGTVHLAEDYVKRYISSFPDWTFKLIPLTKENK